MGRDAEQQAETDREIRLDDDRGRHAERPRDIPKRGWKDIGLRVKQETKDDNLTLIAAGVAFFGLLAVFPALAALISIYGLVADPETVTQQLEGLTEALPQEAAGVITDQLQGIAGAGGGALTWGFVIALVGALWTASSGMQHLIHGVSIAYDESDERGMLKKRALALALTLGGIIVVALAVTAIAILPAVANVVDLGDTLGTVLLWARWPILALVIVVSLAVLYRFAPNRDDPQVRWASWGAVIATVLWLAASIAFSLYVSNFGNFQETYGSLAAIIILLLWLYVTSFVVLLGAEINAEMEHQTTVDTTKGDPRPMGQRNAHAADTVGEAQSDR